MSEHSSSSPPSSSSNVNKWYKIFTEGRENANDDYRPALSSTSTTDENIEQ